MKYIVAIAFLMMPLFAMSQSKTDSALWNVSITPQNLINNCVRFDVERRLSSNNWIGLGPQIYFGNVIETNDAIYGPLSTVNRYNTHHKKDALNGAGLVLEDKIFFQPKYSGYFGFYFN